MGSDYNTANPQQPANVLAQFANYLPALSQLTGAQAPGVAQQQLIAANESMNPSNMVGQAQTALDQANAQLARAQASGSGTAVIAAKTAINEATNRLASAKANPQPLGYNELNLDQLQKYALPEAQVGQRVADSNAQAGARTNLTQITGAGGDAARAATSLNRELNPGFYSASEAATRGATDAVNAINLHGLSPGEASAVERSLNQTNTSTGNLGLVNPMNTISNAMNFGGAFNSKIGLMNNATNAASTAAGATAASGVNPVNIALGQPNASTASNFGAGQFTNTNPSTASGASSNVFNLSSGLANSLTSGNNAAQSAGATMAGQSSPVAIGGSIGSNA